MSNTKAKAPAIVRSADTTPGTAASGDWAIRMEGIGKRYKLGDVNARSEDTLRDAIMAIFKKKEIVSGEEKKGHFWALRDVDLEVKKGETVGIIGRNGAGKSTMLKVLSRITSPTVGEMAYRGKLASLLEVGTGFHRELSGRENIYLNGSILGMRRSEINAQFDAIVDFAGVEKFLDTPVKFYSSGMYVRLAFAVAAHLRTDILVVDEVLAVGDAQFQKKCLGKMQDVAGDGRTVLFVSHNMGAIKALCKSGIYLKSGTMQSEGTIDDVVHEYLHAGMSEQKDRFVAEEEERLPCQFEEVLILDQQGVPNINIAHDEPFRIQLKLKVRKPTERVYIAIHVQDSDFNTILFSRDFTSTESPQSNREPGQYIEELMIPAPLLVPGSYYISAHLACASPPAILHRLDHCVSFEIYDNGSEQSKAGLAWQGKVAIPLQWSLK